MITLNFSVDDQLLTRTDENTVAANSHLVHTCEFVFSSEWDNRGKVATFKKRDLMLSVILDDDACTIPPEILQSENKIDVFELSVCGADGNSTITSTIVRVPILAGTWDPFTEEITPTLFEQIMQKIDEIEKGEVSPELIYEAVSEYMEAHPLEPVIAEDVAAYFVAHVEELKGDKGDTGATPDITATAEVNNAVGTPSVIVTKTGTAENPALHFNFQNLKGVKGDIGETPTISAAATVDNTTGTPAVNVTKSGTDAAPEFTFAFTGLKGPKGDPGAPGASYDDTEVRADINNIKTNLETKANIKPHYNLFPSKSALTGVFLNNVNGHCYESANAQFNSSGYIDIQIGHTYKLVSSGNEAIPNFGLYGREMTDHNMTSGVTNLASGLKPNDTFTATQNTIRFSYYATYENDLKNYALVDIAETTDFYPYNDELTDETTLGEAAIQQIADVATSTLVKPLYGKKILSLGDSFTWQNYYGKYLEKATGATQRGRGQNGNVLMSFCNDSYTGSDGNPVPETFDATLLAEYDAITIMGGTNDYGHGSDTLGAITDAIGTNTIYGSVKYLIDKILTIKPSIKIFFCTQPYRLQYNTDPAPGGYDANSNGLTMANIANAIKECCAYYGIPCFDFYSCSNWNPWTVKKEDGVMIDNIYTQDGLHPRGGNGNGADLLGTALGNFICQHWYY